MNRLNLSSTPQDDGKSSNGGLLTAPREFHPSEVLSEPPSLRDPKKFGL